MCEEKQIMKIYKNERLGKCKNVKGNAKLKCISECSSYGSIYYCVNKTEAS